MTGKASLKGQCFPEILSQNRQRKRIEVEPFNTCSPLVCVKDLFIFLQLESTKADGHMSDRPDNELCCENGGSSNCMQENAVSSELYPTPSKSDSVIDNGGHASPPRPISPVPGTSKSSGIRRRTLKESKRSSPDPVEGDLVLLHVLAFV